MTHPLALVVSLLVLAAVLISAVARSARFPEAAAAVLGALLLLATGAVSFSRARHAGGELGPTIGFLAALLALAEGARREGVFRAIGAVMARRARGQAARLLLLVFVFAATVTALLSLDATVIMLTPVVFVTAARLRCPSKPHLYACTHLANSASLLLPVSNLTNLLAFHASRLSFTRFAALMALPWLGAIGVEWLVIRRRFRADLHTGETARGRPESTGQPPGGSVRPAVLIILATLAGFAASSALGIAPAWIAVAGALALNLPALARRRATIGSLARAVQPGFLVFVLGLGIVVQAASANGLASAVGSVLPVGTSLPQLLAIAALCAVLANLINNLPATLIAVPVAASAGPLGALAVLLGVNIGPNLVYTGSLATLLWRRIARAHDAEVSLREFVALGGLTVPPAILLSTTLLWLSAKLIHLG